MTIINVCNLFAPIVGPLIGIINILILILLKIYGNSLTMPKFPLTSPARKKPK